ncbi:MAG: ABC transporter ATP-binding protein, partial [Omnitrophica WOR_2 bacterium]
DLKTQFELSKGTIYAVNGVSFTVHEGEILGIVGESGCGKSVTALSILRLIEEPGRIVNGEINLYDGKAGKTNLLPLTESQMDLVRGNKISMVFQDPMTSLNPVYTVGFQLVEPLKKHRHMNDKEAKTTAIQLLRRVGIPEAPLRMSEYPHRLSGGMRQRVMVAMAVACRPRLLIADEPTTALDVTIQAQILDLIRELKDEIGTSVIIITHDLGVIAEMANQVAVMYAGLIVESGPVREIYNSPTHPYTEALMSSIPRLHNKTNKLTTIEGAPPSLVSEVKNCPFEPRCKYRIERCAVEKPELVELKPGHWTACWVAQEGKLPHV